jgi:translation initiation factor IF-2
VEVIPISADTGEGLDDLRQMLDNEVGHKLQQ